MDDETTIVRHLMQKLAERQKGFERAAGRTVNADLKTLFLHYAQQRGQFLEELRPFCSQAGKSEPLAEDDMDASSVLSACEREENRLVDTYRQVIDLSLCDEIQRVIAAQGLEIKAAHDKLRSLCHLSSPA